MEDEPGVLAFGISLPEHLINKDFDLYFDNKYTENCSKIKVDCMVYNALHEKKFKENELYMSFNEINSMSDYQCYTYFLSLRKLLNIIPFKKVVL